MRTRDPEAKRQRLFTAALAEFAEFGLAGARIDRLAKRAGISPGLVYSFYAVTATLPAAQLLALVRTIAGMWTQPGEDTRALVPAGQRRQAVIDAVTRLTAP